MDQATRYREEDLDHAARSIRQKAESDPHFARLVEDHGRIDVAICRAEEGLVPTGHAQLVQMRRLRKGLEQEIAGRLRPI